VEANNLINRKPILYLGKDRVNGAYYFLGDKDGVGRFIKYLVYPMWCTGNMVGNFLDIGADVPADVLAELMLFVNGKVEYELLPATRGRAETVVRTDIDTGEKSKSGTKEGTIWPFPRFDFGKGKQTFSGPGAKEEYLKSVGISDETRTASTAESGGSNVGSDVASPAKRRRRTSKDAAVLDSGRDVGMSPPSEANTVQAETAETLKSLASQNQPEIAGDQPVKRKRGRPPKVKTLD
jgi:hypothetical protein